MTPIEWTLIFFTLMFILSRIRIRVIKEESPKEQGGELIETEYLNSLKPPVVCVTELINNQIYVWNKETHEFLTQGKSIEDIVGYFTQNFPGRKIVLVEREE